MPLDPIKSVTSQLKSNSVGYSCGSVPGHLHLGGDDPGESRWYQEGAGQSGESQEEDPDLTQQPSVDDPVDVGQP